MLIIWLIINVSFLLFIIYNGIFSQLKWLLRKERKRFLKLISLSLGQRARRKPHEQVRLITIRRFFSLKKLDLGEIFIQTVFAKKWRCSNRTKCSFIVLNVVLFLVGQSWLRQIQTGVEKDDHEVLLLCFCIYSSCDVMQFSL